jgi:hypothetical protein
MATATVGQLRDQVRGETITAEDPAYEEARTAPPASAPPTTRS